MILLNTGYVLCVYVYINVMVFKWYFDVSFLLLLCNDGHFIKSPLVALVPLNVLKSNFTLLHWPGLYCFDPRNSSTLCFSQQGLASVWIYYLSTIHSHWDNSPFKNPYLTPSLYFLSSFFPVVLGMAKCEFSASRWDWWACAMQTCKRSTNVSLTLAQVPNASPQLQTMSQNKNGPDCQYYIKTST